jgi:outer membrane protein insertion porin family
MPSYPTAQPAAFNSQPGFPPSQAAAGPVSNAASALPGPPPSPPEDLVAEVRVVGNRRTPTDKLMSYIKTLPGRPYNAETVGQDVRRLNGSGLVVRVTPQYQDAPNGRGRIVVYEVFERATILAVKYVGNRKIKTRTLAKETKLKTGDPLEPFAIEEARNRLEAFYKEKGFPNARVSLSEGSKPTDERVVFVINEGSKQTIFWTSFEGNTIASEARLRTQIKSKQGVAWLFGGELDRKQIDQDKERLEAYYHGLGFFRARIGCLVDEHSFGEQREWITLKFVIDEGPRYAVRSLSVVGNKRVTVPELLRVIEMEEGEPFLQDRMQRDQNAIRDRYGAIGHIFADVKPEIIFDEKPGQLDLVYKIEEGERYRVGKIDVDIAGDYPHTQITTVLNRLSLEPGDVIDIRELRDSQRRLRSSQLFKVDPQSGAMPEIAFSPPSQEEIEKAKAQFARRRADAGQFRGQNPQHMSNDALQDQSVVAGDRWYNVTFGAPAATSPNPAAATQPASTQSPPQFAEPRNAPPTPLPPTSHVQRGQSPSSPSLTRFLAPRRNPHEVIRYQYSADGGSSTPTLPPASAAPSYPGTPASPTAPYGNPYAPPAGGAPYAPYVPAPQLPPPNSIGGYGATDPFDPDLNFLGDRDPGGFMGSTPDEYPPIYIPLVPKVMETETGRFMFSAGVNSDAGLIGSIVVDEQNFDWRRFPRSWDDIRNGTAWRGRGQRFRMEAMPGSEVQRYMVTFQEPYLLDSQVSLGLNGFYYTRFYREWDEQRIGGRVSLGYQLAHDLSVSAAFRLERVTVSDPIAGAPPELLDAVGDSDLFGFRAQLTHDTRDSTFLATEGHLLTLGFEQVMGTYQYPRADFDLRKYFMLHERPDGSGRHVVSMKGTASYTGSDTPIYEHYFAGGFSTIRGFDFRGASPRVNGVPVGGEFSLLASTEYMFPLTASDSIRGVVFCDTGAVQPSIDNWEDKYRVAPGFGLRITIPAMGPAPIALDFAFPVVQEDSDEEEMFSFFIGFLR